VCVCLFAHYSNHLKVFHKIFMGEYHNFFMLVPCIFSIKIHLLKSNWCTLLVASTLSKIKVTINTATCFGSHRNHHQGVPQCLAKAIYMVFLVHVDGDVVNGCCAGMCTVWRQDVVFILPPHSTHTSTTGWYTAIPLTTSPSTCTKNHIYSFNQALGDSLMMVPTWTEICWSFYCNFNFI
jgi:hypothetical protein